MRSHHLKNFENQKEYQNEPKFNGTYSRNNWPKIKDGAYVVNRDEFKPIGTHLKALYVTTENAACFYSFGVKHILKEI